MHLERFLEKLDRPVYIVTVASSRQRSGCLVGFVTQCSIDPVRLLVCMSDKNHTYGIAAQAGAVAVHLVPGDRSDLVRLFGSETGDEIDKFSRCDWSPGPGGVPLLAGCPSRLVCEVLDRIPVGDHLALLVQPAEAQAGPEPIFTSGMVRAQGIEPGHPG